MQRKRHIGNDIVAIVFQVSNSTAANCILKTPIPQYKHLHVVFTCLHKFLIAQATAGETVKRSTQQVLDAMVIVLNLMASFLD